MNDFLSNLLNLKNNLRLLDWTVFTDRVLGITRRFLGIFDAAGGATDTQDTHCNLKRINNKRTSGHMG